MAVLPRAEVERIIRKAGADRVSLDAPEALCGILEDKAEQIIERALAIARHARGSGRKKNGRKNGHRTGHFSAAPSRTANGGKNGHSNGKRNGRRKSLVLTREDILLAVS